MKYGEGPCVQAALDDLIVRTDDFRDRATVASVLAGVVELGVLSGLSFKLYTTYRTAGALEPVRVPGERVRRRGGDHRGSPRRARRRRDSGQPSGEQLESALSTRDRIGQAKGIIMERYGVDDMRRSTCSGSCRRTATPGWPTSHNASSNTRSAH